jgi:hypothetical protein
MANYIVFTVVKKFEKEKLEAKILRDLPESECEIINLATKAGDYHWEKKDEIFILNGEMYDVSKKKVVGEDVYLYCITEKKEMQLLDDITLKISAACEGNMAYSLVATEEFIMVQNAVPKGILPLSRAASSRYIATPAEQPSKILIPPPRHCA